MEDSDMSADDLAARFPGLTDDTARREIQDWALRPTAGPYVIGSVLHEDVALDLARALNACDDWQRVWYVVDPGSGDHISVSQEQFAGAARRASDTERYRYSIADVLDSADLAEVNAARPIYDSLACGEVSEWLGGNLGITLSRAAYVNATRMVKDDFLRAHVDHEDMREFGLLIYLSMPVWHDGFGGELGYQPSPRDKYVVPPVHNTATLVRLGASGRHWIYPIASPDFVRITIITHFSRAR